ncbi:uncharacterized protein LOC113797542, partial [Dermatophagoides pteronyssinus]|uniref:uncharacterized protein LOC113797542 n=1 Tax=Dermatophagoides pteronyssinus TaxID=6956 RepID=UPI003F67AC91
KSYDELNDNDQQLNWHTCIFAPLFIYGENRYQFNLALFSSFFCEFLLTYLSWKVVLNPKKRYNLFIQIKQWDQIFQQTFGDNSFKPNQSALIKKCKKLQSSIQYSSINNRKQLRKLCCWLDFYVRAVPIFGCIMMIFFLNMIGLDFLIGYNNYQLSLLFWFSFIFFNIILLFSTFRVVNFSLSWLFILLISALLYHYQYEHVRTRMSLMKSSTKHEYRIKLLCQLNEINGKIMRFAHEISTFVLIFYYVYVIINDMELVLLLDLRSEDFIRYALAVVFFATFTFAVIGFTVFAQLNVYSRRLIPQIERLIYCQNDHQQQQQSSVMSIYDRIISNRQQILQHQQHCQYLPIRLILFRLKLLETHLQLTTNMIGIRCGDIFTITSADNFRSLIFFFINVILISNLFQSHF